ncbi:MAG: hypothetical protein QGG36_02415 [Pirellulaceae bacterium]|jgi:hypothetical protein|nr:hypothetical protein [Pirellulaceae bacterium]
MTIRSLAVALLLAAANLALPLAAHAETVNYELAEMQRRLDELESQLHHTQGDSWSDYAHV